jgi:hypothetical protein
MVTGRVQRGGSPAYQPCEAVDRRFIDATKMIAIEWDRELLERGEVRTLVAGFLHNNMSADWLTSALRVTVRIYGKGADERVRAHMRQIWKMELLK